MFGVAMTLYSLLNVLLFYRLGHGETRICWIFWAAPACRRSSIAAFHSSPRELLAASIATAAVLARRRRRRSDEPLRETARSCGGRGRDRRAMRLTLDSAVIRYALAGLLFALAFVAMFPEVARHPESRVACCFSDGTGTLRDYAIAGIEHKTPFTITKDDYNGAPEGTPRTPATTLANGGIQSAFVWGLRGVLGLVGAWTLFFFLGMVGTGIALFVLLDRLGCGFVPSLFGGYVFAFGTYAMEHAYAGHLGLVQNWVLVLVVGAMIRLRRTRSLGSGTAAGATVAVAFYSSAYQGLFAIVIVLAFVLPELWRLPSRPDRIRSVALLSSVYYSSLLFLAPILILYVKERAAVQAGTGHGYADVFFFSARLSSYFVPSPRNPLFHWIHGIHSSDLTEQTLFAGFTTWALAITALVLVRRRNLWLKSTDTRWWTAIALVVLLAISFALSLPPAYRPGGVPIFMPSVFLTAATTYWRDYARFGIVVTLALASLAAFALTALSRRPGRRWRLLPLAASFLVVLELLPGRVGAIDTNQRPQWVNWLAAHPRGIIADYPLTNNAKDSVTERANYWYAQFDRDPSFEILGGAYYLLRQRQTSIRLIAGQIRSNLAVDILAAEGVRYAVIHDDAYRALKQEPPVPNPRLHLLAHLGSIRIFSVPGPRTTIGTILRTHQLLIAKLQELKPPKIELMRGFGRLQRIHGSTARRIVGAGLLAVRQVGPKNVGPVEEMSLQAPPGTTRSRSRSGSRMGMDTYLRDSRSLTARSSSRWARSQLEDAAGSS